MRPRAILSVAGLKAEACPSERFEQFARLIASVPKAEADREMEKSGLGQKKAEIRKRRSRAKEQQVQHCKAKAMALRANEARRKKNGTRPHGVPVSEKLFRNLRELSESVDANSASVKDAVARSGRGTPDQAVVATAAKYNEALKKLARE